MTLQPPAIQPQDESARWVLLRPILATDDDPLDFADTDDSDGPEAAAHPWSILIVDDDSEVHRAVELALMTVRIHGRGLQLIHCTSAATARTALTQHRRAIDLVLLDVVMETPDAGLTLLDELRSEPETKGLPVLLHTGQPGEAPEPMVRARYDISGYLTKTTVTRQGLIDALGAILG